MFEQRFVDYRANPNSPITYLKKLSAPNFAIYNFIIFSLIAFIVALPFITIDITNSSVATIESNLLKEIVYVPYSGKVSLLRVENNKQISKGDTIFAIDHILINNELEINNKKEAVLQKSLHDLNILHKNNFKNENPVLFDSQYQAQYTHFLQERMALQAKYEKAKKTFSRNSILLEKKVISLSEFEQYELDFKQVSADLKLLETQNNNKWQADHYQLDQELKNLQIRESQLEESVRNSVVTANISGVGYKEEGIQMGVFVQTGQKMAEIVPDSFLIALCYVTPKDIGFIKIGQKVQLQIEAYNFYEWGMLQGSVFEIAKDVSLIQNQPFYTVKCRLSKKFLTLKNGYIGTIMKGMTARANFYLTNRSLWQLLFSSINDWLNPKAI